METEKCEKKLVVVFIRVDIVIQNKCKEDGDYTHDRCKKGLAKFEKARTAVNVIVKSGNVIKQNPEYRNKSKTQKITIGKFYGNIYSEILWFNYGFPVYKKNGPANC